jgi:hypothetical protein
VGIQVVSFNFDVEVQVPLIDHNKGARLVAWGLEVHKARIRHGFHSCFADVGALAHRVRGTSGVRGVELP